MLVAFQLPGRIFISFRMEWVRSGALIGTSQDPLHRGDRAVVDAAVDQLGPDGRRCVIDERFTFEHRASLDLLAPTERPGLDPFGVAGSVPVAPGPDS